ncbi:MAG TPA: hypothetical protein VJ550_14115 [Geomonas sp.]|nr:hypothetical protein [Geomonas sp.]
MILLALYMMGTFKNKSITLFISTAIILDPLLGNKLALTWLSQNKEATLLAPCFALGVIFALYKDKIEICPNSILGSWMLYLLFHSSTYNFYFFYFALFSSILYLSTTRILLKYRPSVDISYGVYLWGFPVQQMMAATFNYGVWFNQIISLIISICLGFLSWHLIEKRFMNIGRRFAKSLAAVRMSNVPLVARTSLAAEELQQIDPS